MRVRGLAKRLIYGPMGRFRYYGSWIHFPRNSVAFRMVFEDGIYEPDIVRCVQTFTRPNTHFLDVGANIGLMSAVALYAQPTATVVSFEPSPNSVPCLRQTVSGHKNWKLVEKALGDKAGNLDFTVGAESVFDGFKRTADRPGQRKVSVAVSTLDFEWVSLGSPEVSLVKIDVEGAEAMVLAGGDRLLRSRRPVLVVEWFSDYVIQYGTDPMWLLGFADRYGYLVYSIPRYVPIRRREDLRAQMVCVTNFLLLPEGDA